MQPRIWVEKSCPWPEPASPFTSCNHSIPRSRNLEPDRKRPFVLTQTKCGFSAVDLRPYVWCRQLTDGQRLLFAGEKPVFRLGHDRSAADHRYTATLRTLRTAQIGREPSRERGCEYVEV